MLYNTIKRKYKNILIFLLVNQKLLRILSVIIFIISIFIIVYYNKLFCVVFICIISIDTVLGIKRDKLKYFDLDESYLSKLINIKELEILIKHKPEIRHNRSFKKLEYYYNLKKNPLEYERIMFENI